MLAALRLARSGDAVTAASAELVEAVLTFLMEPAVALRVPLRFVAELYVDVATFLRGEYGIVCDVCDSGVLLEDSEDEGMSHSDDGSGDDSNDSTMAHAVGELCVLGLRRKQCAAARFVSPVLRRYTGRGIVLPSARDGRSQSPPVPLRSECVVEARSGMT